MTAIKFLIGGRAKCLTVAETAAAIYSCCCCFAAVAAADTAAAAIAAAKRSTATTYSCSTFLCAAAAAKINAAANSYISAGSAKRFLSQPAQILHKKKSRSTVSRGSFLLR